MVRLRAEHTLEHAQFRGLPVNERYEEEAREFLEQALASDAWRIFVAEEGGRIVSHAYLELVAKLPRPVQAHAFWGYVTNVYTVPDRRGRGLAGEVLEAVVAWARGEGLEFLIVWPSDESRPFYARHCFEDAAEPMILELA